MAAGSEHQQVVTQIKEQNAVSDHNHRAALARAAGTTARGAGCAVTATGEPVQRLHHRLVVRRVEAGGGLVQEQQGRTGQQLKSDTGSLALPARQPAHRRAGMVTQPELGDDLPDPAAPLLHRRVRGEAQLGAVLQSLADGELTVQRVGLRDVADPATQLVVLGVEIPTGVADHTGICRAEPGERVE